MKPRHLLIPLLIAAHVLVGLMVWLCEVDLFRYGGLLCYGVIASSQVGLLAIWLALGRRYTPWRLAALVAVVVSWSWIEDSRADGQPHWIYFLLPLATATAIILILARIKALRLYQVNSELNDSSSGVPKNVCPWQFSLGRLFGWTTSLAICLGLLSMMFQYCHNWRDFNWGQVAVFTICSTDVVLLCLLTLSSFRRHIHVAMLAIFLLLNGQVMFYMAGITLHRIFLFLLIPPIVGTLLVFRVVGYRLSWKRKNP